MATTSFSAGDRVVYTDPEDPRNPLVGEVIAVSDLAVQVRYDAHPQAPGLIGRDRAATALRLEDAR